MGCPDCEHLKELHEQRFKAMDEARRLAFEELSRRLLILNHAHEQAVEVQRTYLPRETFEEYKTSTDKALNLTEGKGLGASSAVGWIITAIGVAATLLGIVVVISTHF